jgi:hypothetical protein
MSTDIESFIAEGKKLLDDRQPEAAALFGQAVRVGLDDAAAHNWLGLARLASGRFSAAEAAFDRALQLAPTDPLYHVNYGTALKEQGFLSAALSAYELALKYQPNYVLARWNRSLAWLQIGDFARGWPEYEWRFRREQSPPRKLDRPQWDGRAALEGNAVLIHAEQGLGDTFQFCRFAERIKQCGASRVVMEVQSPIAGVLAGCAGVDQLLVEGQPLPAFDFHLPMLSCPAATQTTLANLPNRVPYLQAEPDRVKHWATVMEKLEATEQTRAVRPFRIGLAWQGNPHHKLDRFRSMALRVLAPLAAIPGAKLYSLQRGPGTEQLDTPAAKAMRIAELTPRPVNNTGDWPDTAAIMMNLDLVITVDTAVAHLAGALARPVWIALAKSPDWRWMLDRDDSPWYPTARLFRQEKLGEWKPVVAEMKEQLVAMRNVG